MASGTVVVLTLFLHDCGDGGNRSRIIAVQDGQLLLQVPEHDALDCDGGRRNGIAAKKPSDKAEHEAANTA